LKKIEDEDLKFEQNIERKAELLRKHREEQKNALVRKHEISDAMATMRITNDFTLLDKLFAKQSKGKDLNKVILLFLVCMCVCSFI
jgi:hypothetical protein